MLPSDRQECDGLRFRATILDGSDIVDGPGMIEPPLPVGCVWLPFAVGLQGSHRVRIAHNRRLAVDQDVNAFFMRISSANSSHPDQHL
jgi:hypothetical protein